MPGTYQVTIQLTARIRTGAKIVASPPADTLTVHVGPVNEAALRARCMEFAGRLTDGTAEEQHHALEALGHLRHPVVIPCFRSLLDNTNRADSVIIATLAKIGTPDAYQVLEELALGNNGDRVSMARSALALAKRR